MKVVLIYRPPTRGAYSLEQLFATVAAELRKRVEVIEFAASSRWSVLTDAWRLRRLRADIYHVTGDVTYFALLLPSRRTVLTVPDIGNYLHGLTGLKRWIYKKLWLEWPMRAADAVLAISCQTRENIVRHLDVPADRVDVIECCHSDRFKPAPLAFNAERPVILQVGTKPYKNVHRLVEALQGISCRLVLVGDLDAGLTQKLADCGIDYVNRRDLTHDDVYREYVECDLVSFVSTGEGFGVPIIEAQATGRPVITSSIPPMCDVAGDGACLVNPLDVAAIREGVLRMISDPCYRDGLVQRGLVNAARYSPSAICDRLLDVYSRQAS